MIAKPTSMTRDEQAARRTKMAQEVARRLKPDIDLVQLLADVAKKFSVTSNSIRSACRENQVDLRPYSPAGGSRGPREGRTAFAVLARLLRGEDQGDIAKKLNITRQRVSKVRQDAIDHGIALPK